MRIKLFFICFIIVCVAKFCLGYDCATCVVRCLNNYSLSTVPTRQTGDCLWYNSPRLDNQWRWFSFSFISEGDALVCLRIGSEAQWREGDIPFYYDDIRINGEPVEMNKGWVFKTPAIGSESKRGGPYEAPGFTISGRSCLRLFDKSSAWYEFGVEKGENVTVSMRMKAGSVLDSYAWRLAKVIQRLDECLEIAKQIKTMDEREKNTERDLIKEVNELILLSNQKLHVSVKPSEEASWSLLHFKQKLTKLVKAYELEVVRTANEKTPILYDNLPLRKTFLDKIRMINGLSVRLKTFVLLNFIRGDER